jgi:hypothetical protein
VDALQVVNDILSNRIDILDDVKSDLWEVGFLTGLGAFFVDVPDDRSGRIPTII